MIRWTVLLSVCLNVISASFDYIYEEHSFMGKSFEYELALQHWSMYQSTEFENILI